MKITNFLTLLFSFTIATLFVNAKAEALCLKDKTLNSIAAEEGDTNLRQLNKDSYNLAALNNPELNEQKNVKDNKDESPKIVADEATNKTVSRKAMLKNAKMKAFIKKTKLKRSTNPLIQKIKLQNKKSRKQQERFLQKRVNMNAYKTNQR